MQNPLSGLARERRGTRLAPSLALLASTLASGGAHMVNLVGSGSELRAKAAFGALVAGVGSMACRSAIALSLLGLLGACERELVAVAPCTRVPVEFHVFEDYRTLDLLFVVDDSPSMAQEQAALAAELPRLIRVLATGDYDDDGDGFGDGEPDDDFDPPESLHVGVVTSDMGSGGIPTATCTEPDFGDDGVLRREGDAPGCGIAYPDFMHFVPFARDAAVNDFVTDVACVSAVGTAGCGYEQPLEAALKALSPSAPTAWTAMDYVPPRFFRDTEGHGDGLNEGFVRPSSVLAIVPVTDEDDCSVRDPTLFDDSGPYGALPRNIRCGSHPEALHDVERYVRGFLQLRAMSIVFVPIVGIPIDLAPQPGNSLDWDSLICDDSSSCDPRLLEETDSLDPSRLRPSCEVSGGGRATPPTRILRVARELEWVGAHVSVQSICQLDLEPVVSAIARETNSRLGWGECLPRPLPRQPDGSVPCEIRLALPEGMECAEVPGAWPVFIDGVAAHREGRALCELAQIHVTDDSRGAAPPDGPGWYYDDFTERNRCWSADVPGQRLAFTPHLPWGGQARASCLVAVRPPVGSEIGIGTSCGDSGEVSCEPGVSPSGTALSCDPLLLACGVACTRDADCRDAGLASFVCDRRALSDLHGRFEGLAGTRDMCVNPVCER